MSRGLRAPPPRTLFSGAWCLLWVVCALVLPAGALRAADWRSVADPVFQRIGHDQNGPVALGPVSLARDATGYLWIGTQDGLVRWDGYRFTRYRAAPGRPAALPDAFVQHLHLDRQGRLWAGTAAGGLVRYRPDSDDFERFGVGPGGLPHPDVVALAEAADGGLWVGTDAGLSHLDPATRRVTPHPFGRDGGARTRISALAAGRDGHLWVGREDGVWRRDAGTAQWLHLPETAPLGGVQSLYEDASGRLWIGTRSRGAWVLDPGASRLLPVHEAGRPATLPLAASVSGIAQAPGGVLWISTKNRGLLIVDPGSLSARVVERDPALPQGLDGDTVWAVLPDGSGAMWVAGDRYLLRHDAHGTAALQHLGGGSQRPRKLSASDADALLAMPDESLWVASAAGIEVLRPGVGRVAHRRPGVAGSPHELPAMASFALLRQGRTVWVGTESGLYRTDDELSRVQRVALARREPAETVWTLHADDAGLWVGGPSGLWRMPPGDTGAAEAVPVNLDGLTDHRVELVAPAGPGRLWVATRSGLHLLDVAAQRTTPYPPTGSEMPSLQANALLTDARGRLWVGTSNQGIVVVEQPLGPTPRMRQVGEAEGLRSLNVNHLLADDQGRVWASTDDGLALVDPDRLTARPIGLGDGVAVSTYWSKSGAQAPDGTLFFGGQGGVTVVRPAAWRPASHAPRVVATELRVDGQPAGALLLAQAARTEATLPIGTRALAVDFAALDLAQPERNQYSYRMAGRDTTWTPADSRHRTAAYTNLDPGHYTLEVRGSNRDGQWSPHELRLAFEVPPAWHQTTLFRVLLGLAGLATLVLLEGARTEWMRRRQRLLEELVASRTDELQRSQAQLHQLAYSDPLTGLANRRCFSERFDQMASLWQRHGMHFALLLVDLDHFKQINDQLGHAAGDALLAEVATRLAGSIRGSDTAFRLGGDEFALLLAGPVSAEQVEGTCRRLIPSVGQPVPYEGMEMRTSPSIGVALFPQHGDTQDALYAAADRALYEAKAAGRNAWRMAQRQPAR